LERLFLDHHLVKDSPAAKVGDCIFTQGPLYNVPGIGGLLGSTWAVVMAAVVGLNVAILYAIVDTIVSLVQALVNAIVRWFTGGGNGSLNLLFSSDDGLTFDHKVTFEQSAHPMALALSAQQLFVGWTGTDNAVNVWVAPSGAKTTFEQSTDCGPALAHDGTCLLVAWQGTDNRLNLLASTDGKTFGNKVTLPETSPGNATPGLAFGGGWFYLAWIGTDSRLNFLASQDGLTWDHKLTLNETSGNDGTAALAYGAGSVYLS
jgi:hypothetical protein